MNWLVFCYSLPAQSTSSTRVALWRRLKRWGALALAGGAQLLPANDECLEAFQWMAQEVQQAKGEALVIRAAQFEGLDDRQLVDLFCAARAEEYATIGVEVDALEKALKAERAAKRTGAQRDELERLLRRHAEVARTDYFNCAQGIQLMSRLVKIQQILAPHNASSAGIVSVARVDYKNKRWVTRPRPHVDRLACVWLIRRFIDPQAKVRYATQTRSNEIAFDMDDGTFGHHGNLCTFETMLRAFDLDDTALRALAEIVHEIDLRDGRYARPETNGIDAILQGWLLGDVSDAELETQGVALFEGVYATLSSMLSTQKRKK